MNKKIFLIVIPLFAMTSCQEKRQKHSANIEIIEQKKGNETLKLFEDSGTIESVEGVSLTKKQIERLINSDKYSEVIVSEGKAYTEEGDFILKMIKSQCELSKVKFTSDLQTSFE